MWESEPLLTVSTTGISVFTLQRLHTLPTSRVTRHAMLIRHTHHNSLDMAAWVHYEAFTKTLSPAWDSRIQSNKYNYCNHQIQDQCTRRDCNDIITVFRLQCPLLLCNKYIAITLRQEEDVNEKPKKQKTYYQDGASSGSSDGSSDSSDGAQL